jgi:hypothetical protein
MSAVKGCKAWGESATKVRGASALFHSLRRWWDGGERRLRTARAFLEAL